MLERITITLEIDRQSLNQYLGNTPNATLAAGMSEILDDLFSTVNHYCDSCGRGTSEATGVTGKFEIIAGDSTFHVKQEKPL